MAYLTRLVFVTVFTFVVTSAHETTTTVVTKSDVDRTLFKCGLLRTLDLCKFQCNSNKKGGGGGYCNGGSCICNAGGSSQGKSVGGTFVDGLTKGSGNALDTGNDILNIFQVKYSGKDVPVVDTGKVRVVGDLGRGKDVDFGKGYESGTIIEGKLVSQDFQGSGSGKDIEGYIKVKPNTGIRYEDKVCH